MPNRSDINVLLAEARAAVRVVAARVEGEPTTAQEWLIIGLQLRAAERAANEVADMLRREEKDGQQIN